MKIIEGEEYKEFLRKKAKGRNGQPEFKDSNLNDYEKALKTFKEGRYQPTDSYNINKQVAFGVDTWAYAEKQKGEVIAIKRVPKSQIKEKKNKEGLVVEENKKVPGDFKVINHLYIDEKNNTIRAPHKNIVAYKDAFVYKNDFYFIMEYLPFEFHDIRRRATDIEDHITAFMQLCDGLNFIHTKKLIHRDLHPGNIRCDEDKDTGKLIPKILDFGLARGEESETGDKEIGSPSHRAPDFKYTKASDIYSLVTLLFESLTGDTLESKCNEFCKDNQKVSEDLAKIKLGTIDGALIDSTKKTVDIEDSKDKKIAERKVKLKYFCKEISSLINNEYLAAIIQKGIQPEQNNRYQFAQDLRTDLCIAKRSEEFAKLVEIYKNLDAAIGKRITEKKEFSDLADRLNAANEQRKKFCEKLKEDGVNVDEKIGPDGCIENDISNSYLMEHFLFRNTIDAARKNLLNLGLTRPLETIKTIEEENAYMNDKIKERGEFTESDLTLATQIHNLLKTQNIGAPF